MICDPGALAGFARDADRAAMRLDDRAADTETEPGSAPVAGAPVVDPVEAVKDVREMLGWDAAAGVLDPELGIAGMPAGSRP